MSAPHVLIVEDQRALAMALAAAVRQAGASPEIAPTVSLARRSLDQSEHGIAAMILDIGLPDQNGLDFFAELPAESRPPTIVVTAHGEIDNTIAARKLGIAEFLTKPLDFRVFTESLQRILPESEPEPARDSAQRGSAAFIGASPAMRPVFQHIAHACASGEPVLISGETGTGKTLAASVIKNNSASGDATFAAFQPGAGDRLVDFQAALDRAGGGSFLLEEIENLDRDSQTELIRRWESGDDSFPRILATSGDDLRDAVEAGTVRSDLYYRLQVLEVRLPPLRDRIEDLPALFDFFLAEVSPERRIGIEAAALRQLQNYDWPGNLRELRSVASFAVTVSGGATRIGPAELPDHVRTKADWFDNESEGALDRALAAWIDSSLAEGNPDPTYRKLSGDLERRLILHLLDRHDGKLARLATAMQANRTTLRKKLKGP